MAHDHDHPHHHTPGGRAEFHRQNQARAIAEAERLLAERERLQGRWLTWVASELYAMSPPALANMVRRELERLSR